MGDEQSDDGQEEPKIFERIAVSPPDRRDKRRPARG